MTATPAYLPGYALWLDADPNDARCEHCGATADECKAGWQPDACDGTCRRPWRDPDHERDRRRDDGDERDWD